ncbi:hypothetical protein EUTSA_v10002686mg [Eutrema salsugineum]|uniref:M-phase phosphoprotein 6 n=1 Tax=Eutrema salsugineum TaxID=72664 RepID=V4KHJ9_EUTSA|nr:uncharacterized protein LOC18014011 [Eutrema salsugineum]ESQ37315.1 hypothetical protein EUTSA_v10002686mg [Eutrema salsugineum]
MAKRELSGTLRNLKFMQRATLKVEKKKNDEEPNENSPSLSTVRKKCVVITDWDPQPQPSALVGRMSFQSFNPYIEKLNEEALNGQRTVGSTKSCSSNEGKVSFSQNASCLDEPECPKIEPSQESNGNMKRKQSEAVSEQHYPNKFRKNGKGNAFKHRKSKKVDWSVLKPSKTQTQTG